MRLQCDPDNPRVFDPLDMEWDPVSGTLTGQGEKYVKDYFQYRGVSLHPIPREGHEFSAEPLKSHVDMAAVIGCHHRLPDVLVPYYPYIEEDEDEWDGNVRMIVDGEEVVIGQVVY